jgi:hypothetical protein
MQNHASLKEGKQLQESIKDDTSRAEQRSRSGTGKNAGK